MGFIEKFFGRMSRKDMYSESTYVGRDDAGSHWYVPTWVRNLFGGSGASENDYRLDTPEGKRMALRYCYPFASVIDRAGKMMMNGKFYVVDANGNEKPRFRDVKALLEHPNVMQNGRSFLYQVETYLKAYGFCPVYLLRVGKSDVPSSMVPIPPHIFHIKGTGKLFKQTEREEIISEAYVEMNGARMILEPEEYCVIYDSIPEYPLSKDGEITFATNVDSLSPFTRNYMSAVIARGNLISNGGPKGILYGDDNSEWGNAALTPKEADEMNRKFKDRYGLVKKMYEIMVTDKKVGWISLGSDVEQLCLHKETDYCMNDICNAIGMQPDLFSQGSKFENKEAAKRGTYQDLIIPDAYNIADTLTSAICPEGCMVTIDFSEVACLQDDRNKCAETLVKMATALKVITGNNTITPEEARRELAKYIDIDPEKPFGSFRGDESNADGQQTTGDEKIPSAEN